MILSLICVASIVSYLRPDFRIKYFILMVHIIIMIILNIPVVYGYFSGFNILGDDLLYLEITTLFCDLSDQCWL